MRRSPGPLPLLAVVVTAVLWISPSMAYVTYDAPKEAILLVGAALLLVERLVRRTYGRGAKPPGLEVDAPLATLGLLLLVLTVAFFRAYDPALAGRRLGVLVAGAVLLVEARARFREARAFRMLLIALTATGCIVAIYGILQRLGLEPFDVPSDRRAVSTLGNPNFAGSMLVLLVPGAAALALRARGGARVALVASLLLMLVHLAVTKNRAGTLIGLPTAAAGAAGVWFAARIARRPARIAALTAIVLLFPLAGLALVGGVRASTGPLPLLGRMDTIRVRSLIWSGTASLVAEEPLLGHGLTDFTAEYPRVRPREEFRISLHRDVGTPHNDLLEMAVEAGVLAPFLAVALLALLIGGVLRRRRESPEEDDPLLLAALGATLGLAATGLFSSPLSHPGHVAAFCTLLGAVAGRCGPIGPSRIVPGVVAIIARCALVLGLAVVSWFSIWHAACEASIQARERSRTGNLQVYLRHVRDSVEREPGHVGARIQAGRVALNRGETEEARTHFHAVLEVQPYHVRALTGLGSLEIRAENYPEALRWYRRAMDINPDFVPLLRNLATVYQRIDRPGEAAILLRHAVDVALEPESVRPFLIEALARTEETEEAVEQTKTLITRLGEADRADEIRSVLCWVIQRSPSLTAPLCALATRRAREGRFEEAEPLLAAIVVTRGASGEVWTALERVARDRGDEIRARSYLARSKLVYAADAARENDLVMAERHLDIAEKRGAPEGDVLFVRALIDVRAGRLAEGLTSLRRAAEAGFSDMDRLTGHQDVLDPIVGSRDWDRIVLRVRANR